MGEGVEIWRGSVAAWECDVMGHLNVGYYVAKAMEGLVCLAAELGMPRAFAADALSTVVVRDQHIRFLREARAGAPLSMTGGVLEIGDSEARLSMVLRHHDGEIAATFQTVVAHVTAHEARPFPWPARVLKMVEALRVETPPTAGPRSVGVEPVQPSASLERADALGLQRLAMGAIGAGDCDVFGRVRTEMMMARISEGMPHVVAGGWSDGADGGPRLGGAALEYRLVHLAWPRAGDRLTLRSGFSAADPRFRRIVHWLLDPASGRPWGVAEVVSVALDLDARKMVVLGDEALAGYPVVRGLTL